MRWGCPHCGVSLSVADEKLGVGWSFSRCYKCGGFALIRRAEVNLIKVDRAPMGEQVILPENSEEPLLSQEAAQNLAKYTTLKKEPMERPVIKPAFRQTAFSASVPPVPPLPEPLPEIPRASFTFQKYLPLAIGLAGAVAVGSGIYLYLQGQALWEKAKAAAVFVPPVSSQVSPSTGVIQAPPLTAQTEVKDEVRHNAMAPERTSEEAGVVVVDGSFAPADSPQPSVLVVKPKVENAHLRAGPGAFYPLLGKVNLKSRYLVMDWNDRWFKIAIQTDPTQKTTAKTAWIRNDLVQIIRALPNEKLSPYP